MSTSANINISQGQAPFTVVLLGTQLTWEFQEVGTYLLENLPTGNQTFWVSDALGCEYEFPVSFLPEDIIVDDTVVEVIREPSICEITVHTVSFIDWITMQNNSGSNLTELKFVTVSQYGYLSYGEAGAAIQADDIIQFPLTQGIYYHSSDIELAAYNDIMTYQVKSTGDYSNTGTITFNVGSCLGEVGDCLNGLIIETIYLRVVEDQDLLLPGYEHPCMYTGHICNGAFYEIFGNNVYIGDSLMNNSNGVSGALTQSGLLTCTDYDNTPDAIAIGGVWTGNPDSRYSRVEINQQQALAIAAASGGGTIIDFSMTAAMITYNSPECRSIPHSEITWTRISANDGTVYYNGCPEGYFVSIDVCNPPAWNKVATFQTNSPGSTTFDPVVTSVETDSNFKWVIGNDEYYGKSLAGVYLDGNIQDVELWVFGVPRITGINMASDHLVGIVDLSNPVFKWLTTIVFTSNAGLTSIVYPSVFENPLVNLTINICGFSGIMDLSMFNKLSNAVINISSNSQITGVTMPVSYTGTVAWVAVNNCGLTGTLDLSMFDKFSPTILSTLGLNASYNPSLENIILPASITGFCRTLSFTATGISSLDLRAFNNFSATTTYSGLITINSCPNLTTLQLPTTVSGYINQMYIFSNPLLTSLDLSGFKYFSSASIGVYNNGSLTTLSMPSSVDDGTINLLYTYGNTVLTNLDLSAFVTWQTLNLRTYLCPLLSNLILPATITASTTTARSLFVYNNAAGLTVNIPNGTYLENNTGTIKFEGNGWTAAKVNETLTILDSISTNAYTGRTINISGNNAAPDNSSGGFDGLAAKASLEAKGFGVTVTV